MTQSPLIQPIQSDAQLCAACPSKKTTPHKESIYGTDAYRALHDQLDQANERIHQLEEEMGMRCFVAISQLDLTLQQSIIFSILIARKQIRHTSLFSLVGNISHSPYEMTPDSLKVQVHHMRRKLRRHGIEIETIWGEGYRISEENISRAKALVSGIAA